MLNFGLTFGVWALYQIVFHKANDKFKESWVCIYDRYNISYLISHFN